MSTPEQQNFINMLASLLETGRQNGSKFDASSISKNPEMAATLSKLVLPREQIDPAQYGTDAGVITSGIGSITAATSARVEENEHVFMLFTDIELCVQIIISSMLSPKDNVQTDIIYRLDNNRFSSTLSAKLLDIVREEIETHYKLKARLYDIFRDAMFRSGSHPIAILPEAAVDYIINVPVASTESSLYDTGVLEASSRASGSLFDTVVHLGYIGNADQKTVSTESSGRSVDYYSSRLTADPKLLSNLLDPISGDEGIFTDKSKAVEFFTDIFTASTEVIDNSDILRLPIISQRQAEEKIRQKTSAHTRSRLTASLESTGWEPIKPMQNTVVNQTVNGKSMINEQKMRSSLYKSNDSRSIPYFAIPAKHNLPRLSVGRPLELELPAESLVPIHTPGNYRKHIGYWCALDAEGTPLTFRTASDHSPGASALMANERSGKSISGLLTERAKKNLINDNYTPMISQMAEIYANVIERDLVQRLSRKIYKGKDLRISKELEIYEVMVYRALKGHFTRILFIPAEYVTYFAFDYNRNGVGRSALDQLSNITSLRAMVLYSKVWAQVRSSIETTEVKITFDPRDPDPVKTTETVEHLVARSRQQIFPNGLRRIADFTDWIQRAGIRITFDGHPRLPNTRLDFESTNIEHVQPNDTLDSDLREMTYMHFGLSPETVQGARDSNLAISVATENVLLSKRISMHSDAASIDMTDYARKVFRHDSVIQKRFVEAFKDNRAEIEKMITEEEKAIWVNEGDVAFTEYLLELFASSLVLDLPRPDSTTNANLEREIDGYEKLIDKVLMFIIDEEILPEEYIGDAANYVQSLRNVWKAELMRQYLSDNNVTPEAFRIAILGDDNKPMVDVLETIENHTGTIQLALLGMLKRLAMRKKAANTDLESIGADGESSTTSFSSDDSGSDTMGSDDNFGFPTDEEDVEEGSLDDANPFEQLGNPDTEENEDDNPNKGNDEQSPEDEAKPEGESEEK